MFRQKTVFVIGAGCSADYGFDVGGQLRDSIAQKLVDEDDGVMGALVRIDGGNRNVSNRMQTLARGIHTHETIDQFLDFRQSDPVDVALGKLTIASCILEQESKSDLLDEKLEEGLGPVARTWFPVLFNRIMTDLGRANVKSAFQNLTFICFNYDRCIEQIAYWATALATTDEALTTEVLEHLTVLHPYGSLGNLPWQHEEGPTLEFGVTPANRHNVGLGGRNIRTFTQTVSSGTGMAVRGAINEARQVCFVGFGFIRQNMELLQRDNEDAPRVIANMYGMPEPERVLARTAIRAALFRRPAEAPPVVETDLPAGQFMSDWGRTLIRN